MEAVLAGPQPWRVGHLLLPGGSSNLGSPGFELRPRTRAPLVGTLLEARAHLRAPAVRPARLMDFGGVHLPRLCRGQQPGSQLYGARSAAWPGTKCGAARRSHEVPAAAEGS